VCSRSLCSVVLGFLLCVWGFSFLSTGRGSGCSGIVVLSVGFCVRVFALSRCSHGCVLVCFFDLWCG